jgi:hypothetical protein
MWPFAVVGAFNGAANRARERTECRVRFLAGDESAIPLALQSVAPGADASTSTLPFELVGPGVTGVSASTVALGYGLLVLLVVAPLVLILTGIIVSSPINQDTPGSGPIVVVITVGVTAIVEVLLVFALRRLSKTPLSNRLIATEEGLVRPRGRRPPALIRWHDARLFEIIAPSREQSFKRGFALEGVDTVITWYEWPKTDAVQHRTFLAIVAARTGLPLRALSPSLEWNDPIPVGHALQSPRRAPARVYVIFTLLAAVLFGLATAVVLVPLTDILSSTPQLPSRSRCPDCT